MPRCKRGLSLSVLVLSSQSATTDHPAAWLAETAWSASWEGLDAKRCSECSKSSIFESEAHVEI